MSTPPARPVYTEDDWIQIRAHFMSSFLVDIHLHKLAQNVGTNWPNKDEDETPAKYLEYSFEDLRHAPGMDGRSSRVQLLLDILKETAAFDDPFQDMMEAKPNQNRTAATTEQLLQQHGISADFPLKFVGLSPETKDLCVAEGAVTIGQCASLLQKMAQSVILGGEVRDFLNALAHGNQQGLAKFLPLRVGTKGVRLAETIALLIRNLPDAERAAFMTPSSADHMNLAEANQRLRSDLDIVLEWFPSETAELRELVLHGKDVKRFFHPLNDPELEMAAVRVAVLFFAPPPAVESYPEETESGGNGLWGRLTSFFRSRK